MATVTAKLLTRYGNLADLPFLSMGEQGFAVDAQRLFIGNERTAVVVAADNGQLYASLATAPDDPTGLDLDLVYKWKVMNGEIDITSNVTVDNFTLNINGTSAVPGDILTVLFNTEILTYLPDREDDPAVVVSLPATQLSGWINKITIDPIRYDSGEIKYSLTDGTDKRVGTIAFTLLDNDYAITDNYTTTSETSLPHEFDFVVVDEDADPQTPQVFVLSYTTTTTAPTSLSFVTNFWKS